MKKRQLLIISNNVLSETNNNGKTILSFVNGINDIDVSQLYLSGEIPKISGYNYFQISDKDIISGLFNKSKRGKRITPQIEEQKKDDDTIKQKVGRNDFTLLVRELLWYKKWKTKELDKWLDAISPDAIFFVAGDACFAYSICEYIQARYSIRLSVYVTDDYVMPRKKENMLHKLHRFCIINDMKRILKKTTCFYTISNTMKEAYSRKFNKNSNIVMNITEDLKETREKKENEIIFIYTGSFYYGRAEVLGRVVRAIKQHNELAKSKPAKLMMFCNKDPGREIKNIICADGAGIYGGSLNKMELKEKLNEADILVFVESFDEDQIEKVRYSLSTKVPEYMSIGKPILAIGPRGVGSIEYLQDVAYCINDTDKIENEICDILLDIEKLKIYGFKSRKKFIQNHNRQLNQKIIIKNIMGQTISEA